MGKFIWSDSQMADFFNIVLNSYDDYLHSRKMRKLDNFFERMGNHIGATGSTVQNFLKKVGRVYRSILLRAEISGNGVPEKSAQKIRGSAQLYQMYETYYKLYVCGSNSKGSRLVRQRVTVNTPQPPPNTAAKCCNKRQLETTKNVVDRKPVMKKECTFEVGDADVGDYPPSRASTSCEVDGTFVDYVDGSYVVGTDVDGADIDGVDGADVEFDDLGDCIKRDAINGRCAQAPTRLSVQADSVAAGAKESPTVGAENVFGKNVGNFQESFLSLMENQNKILANIADELNLIRHAVLDVNGLKPITYLGADHTSNSHTGHVQPNH